MHSDYVTIKRSLVIEALAWAKENCPGYITNDYHMINYNSWDENFVDFFFTTDQRGQQEMTLFSLKWL